MLTAGTIVTIERDVSGGASLTHPELSIAYLALTNRSAQRAAKSDFCFDNPNNVGFFTGNKPNCIELPL